MTVRTCALSEVAQKTCGNSHKTAEYPLGMGRLQLPATRWHEDVRAGSQSQRLLVCPPLLYLRFQNVVCRGNYVNEVINLAFLFASDDISAR